MAKNINTVVLNVRNAADVAKVIGQVHLLAKRLRIGSSLTIEVKAPEGVTAPETEKGAETEEGADLL